MNARILSIVRVGVFETKIFETAPGGSRPQPIIVAACVETARALVSQIIETSPYEGFVVHDLVDDKTYTGLQFLRRQSV